MMEPMDLTAAFAVKGIELVGIPVYSDGLLITIPPGNFEVAEACAGLRFLIATIALGFLFSYLTYNSIWRRAAFLALSVVVPIVANGIRAWGIVFLGYQSDMTVAVGFDHIIYGWIFFAIVVALVLALSWRFFDRPLDGAPVGVVGSEASPLLDRLEAMRAGPMAALLALGAILIAAQVWTRAADALSAPLAARIDLPAVPGWHRIDYAPRVWWEPRASGAGHRAGLRSHPQR